MAIKAQRGWWLAVEYVQRDFYIGRPMDERTRVELMEVTSCTRDGFVKECKDARGYNVGSKWIGGRVLTIPPEMVPSADVRRVALEHHYDGHPNQPKPFDSLEELRDALRPYRVKQSA